MIEQSNADSPATSAISERRQSPRLTLAKLVYIHLEPESGAIVLNVSEGGLGFHAVAPVTQTGAIRFWVSLNVNQRVEASGQLAWTDESRKTGGLRFAALSEGARQQIRKWINQPSAPVSVAKRLGPLDPPVTVTGQSRVLSTAAIPPSATHGLPLESPGPALREQVLPSSQLPGPTAALRPEAPSPEPSLLAQLPAAGALETTPERPRPFAASMYWEPPNAEVNESKPKFFRGFLAGVAACLLITIIFLGYTYRVRLSLLLAPLEPKSSEYNSADSNRQVAPSPASQAPPAYSSAASAPSEPDQAPAPVPSPTDPPRSPELPVARDSSSLDLSAKSAPPVEPRRAAAQVNSPSRRYPAARPPQPSASVAPPDPDSAADIDAAERYLQGIDGPRNPSAAAQFLWAAIQKGSSTAEIILADLYTRGDGVPKNCTQARVLLSAAADRGNVDAQQRLQNLKSQGCF